MSKNNQFLRAVHTFVSYDEQLNSMTVDSVSLYDLGLYFLRQEYFRCRDLNWSEIPKYPSKFGLFDLVNPTDAFQNSKLDINVKKECISLAYNNWFSWIKTKKDYRVHPEKYKSEPKMPKYKYRKKTHNIISIDKTRFRGKDANKITLPCSDYKIQFKERIYCDA